MLEQLPERDRLLVDRDARKSDSASLPSSTRASAAAKVSG
jgi:hypothetical protein